MNWVRAIWQRFTRWYWGDFVKEQRHRIEVDARRFNGVVTWRD